MSTPSYALVIAQAVHDAGIDPAALRLELGLFGGEPWTEGLREEIERALPGLRAVNFYGLSEMCGPGVAAECLEVRDGLHVHEDHFIVEVVDPESGAPVEEGVEGELVFTTLLKEAMPFLRYRTGDIASVTFEPCRCGRTTARIRGLRGRRDDMVIVRGRQRVSRRTSSMRSSPFPTPPRTTSCVVERNGLMDELTVQCEPTQRRSWTLPLLRTTVEQVLREQLGIRVRADVARARGGARSEGKAVRVVDRRRAQARAK